MKPLMRYLLVHHIIPVSAFSTHPYTQWKEKGNQSCYTSSNSWKWDHHNHLNWTQYMEEWVKKKIKTVAKLQEDDDCISKFQGKLELVSYSGNVWWLYYKSLCKFENCVSNSFYFFFFKNREKRSNICFFVISMTCESGTYLILLLKTSF